MLNLLNASKFDITMFWMLVILGILLLIEIAAFAILLIRRSRNSEEPQEEPVERKLVNITLDLGIVQREFAVGEEFNCSGLIVRAIYNADPTVENVVDCVEVTAAELEELKSQGELSGCYVIAPDSMDKMGKKTIRVLYQDMITVYTIAVGDAAPERIVERVIVAEPVEEPVAEPVVEEVEREIVGISLDLEVVQREFTVGDEFNCEGILITADFNLDPLHENIAEYSLVEPELLDRIASESEIAGCYVIKPDMSEAGKKVVTVKFENFTSCYTIAINEPVAEVVEEEVLVTVAEPEVVRELVGISLDFEVVQREFTVGDEFNCDGLLINADFNVDPMQESIIEYSVVDSVDDGSEIEGCYVIKPDMSEAGKKAVAVKYEQFTAYYTIAVEEPVVEVVEEPVAAVAEAVVAEEIDRDIVGISIDVQVVQREFTVGDEFNCEGILITAHFNVDPLEERIVEYSLVEPKYIHRIGTEKVIAGCYVFVPDMSEAGKKVVTVKFEKFTAYYTIAVNEPVVEVEEPEIVRELVGISLDVNVVQREFTVGDQFNCDGLLINADFNVDPMQESIVEYSVVDSVDEQGEVAGCYVIKPDMSEVGKKNVSVKFEKFTAYYTIAVNEPVVEVVAEPQKERQALIYEEDSADNRLRYDKSFTARLIQSDDELKLWYTDIKNELLSYKKSKARMSWKRETFKCGKIVVAKLAYRGKTMCLLLPLNAADFVDSKYHVEDVSDTPSNVDTPLMYRLKNARRVKYAIELIQMAMEKLGIERIERMAEDYYVPYEGLMDLINKGLVKREIKTAADEAIFNQGKEVVEVEENNEPKEIAEGIYVTKKS